MNPLTSIWGTIISGFVLAVIISLIATALGAVQNVQMVIIWLHVLAGVAWIGLLYYFNFVQVPAVAQATADKDGPGPAAINKYVAPRALAWFRWAAVATWLTGAIWLLHNGQFINAFTLGAVAGTGNPTYGLTIGIGAWLGTIMLFNVWVLIWPNQKKVLGIVSASDDEKASAKKIALMASRTNTMLSIPMLMSMIAAHRGFFL